MRELLFYPAFKNANDKYEPLLLDRKNKPQHIYWKSQSFIDIPSFTEVKPSLTKKDIAEEYLDNFTLFDECEILYLYPFSLNELSLMANEGNNGLISGYVEKEIGAEYYSLDKYERQKMFHYEIELYPAEFILSLPLEEHDKYVKITHLDTYSTAYNANILAEVLERIVDYEICDDDNAYILVNYSF